MLTRSHRRSTCAVATTATGISATATRATVPARTGLGCSRHSARGLRATRHGRARGTQRCARPGTHGCLLLSRLRLCNTLRQLWIRRNNGTAGLRLCRAQTLSSALRLHGRAILLRGPRHCRCAGCDAGPGASQRLVGLGPRHRHARGSGRSWSRRCARRARGCARTLRSDNLTRPRSQGHSLCRARLQGRVRCRGRPQWGSRCDLCGWRDNGSRPLGRWSRWRTRSCWPWGDLKIRRGPRSCRCGRRSYSCGRRCLDW